MVHSEPSEIVRTDRARPSAASEHLGDLVAVGVLFAASVVVFGWRARTLGLHSDDAGLLVGLGDQSFSGALQAMRGYTPGRPLHVVWAWMILQAAGNPTEHLGRMHIVQSLLDGVAVGLFFVLLRTIRIPRLWAFVAGLIFAFYPNHGETHYWLTAAPQNIACVIFVLLNSLTATMSIREAARGRWRWAMAWCAAGWAVFTLGAFTYEQGLVWMGLLGAVQTVVLAWMGRGKSRVGYFILPAQAASVAGVVWLKSDGFRAMDSGPTMQFVSAEHLSARYGEAMRFSFDPFRYLYEPFNLAGDWIRLVVQPVMVAVVVVLLIACAVMVWRSDRAAGGARPEWYYFALLVLACGLFFAAYLPACMWFISPRHNYLPTAAVCAAGACGATLVDRTVARLLPRAANRYVVRPVIAAVGLVLAAAGIAVAGEESANWAASYQLRRGFYAEMLAHRDLSTARSVVLEGFPLFHRGVPCFANESIHALKFESRRRVNVDWVSESSIDVEAGRYLNVRADRWGPEGIKFVPAGRSAKFVCTGVVGEPPRVKFDESRGVTATEGRYRIEFLPMEVAGSPATGTAIGVETAERSADGLHGDELRIRGWIDRRQLRIPVEGSAGLLLWWFDEAAARWEPHTAGEALKLLMPMHVGASADLAGPAVGRVRFVCMIRDVPAAKRYRLVVRGFDTAGGVPGGEAEFEAGPGTGASADAKSIRSVRP